MLEVNLVELGHELAEAVVEGIIQEHPVLFPLFVPFPELGEFIAHEVELLAGVGHHVKIQGPGLGEFFFVIPVHLLGDGRLAVDHLVVGQGQQEAFIVKILHGEGQLVVVPAPIFRSGLEDFQGVVHPAHVPFVVEAQAPLGNRHGGPLEGGGVLRRQDDGGVLELEPLVHVLEELDGVLVFPAVFIPLPVDQAADSVHAQTVEMVELQPVIGGGLEEAAHLRPGVHEIAAPPLALAHVGAGVGVQVRAVVMPQGVVVHGEMDGDKIHDDPDVFLMALVDEVHELRGGAVPGGGAEEPRVLITPGFVAGVFGQGHDLDVVVALFLQVGDELGAHFIVAVPVVHILGLAAPGAEMHFVNVQRAVLFIPALLEPALVAEGELPQIPQDGRRPRPLFHHAAVGIAVIQGPPVGPGDAVLIHHPGLGLGDHTFPKIAVVHLFHGLARPIVPLPDDVDCFRFGGEGPEDEAVPLGMGSQIIVSIKTFSLIKPLKIHCQFLHSFLTA